MPAAENHPNPAPRRPACFREPSFTWRKAGRVGWWLRPEWASILVGPDGLRLREWQAAGLVEEVKRSPQRVVYRVRLPEGGIYIKQFLVPGKRELFRQWLRRGKGRNEGRRAAELAGLGVPTIEPIALGEERRRGFLFENYLISAEIPDALPLDRFLDERLAGLPPSAESRLRRELARSLGRLTARLHRAGLVHDDYHAGNVLARIGEGGRLELAMIDLDALRRRPRLGRAGRLANLSHLNHSFWLRSTRTERLRFLRAYLDELGERAEWRGWAARIERRTRAWAERLWRRWGRRCTGSNKYFRVIREGRAWAVASRALEPSFVAGLLRDPDAPFSDPRSIALKESRTTSVAEVEWTVGGEERVIVYKRFNRKKRLERLWTLLRPSRGWRSWRAGHHLASRGLPTPENLLILGRDALWGGLGPAATTYLATRKVEPSATIGEVFREVLPRLDRGARFEASRRLSRRMARLVRSLHDRSISDRDLKASNVLLVGGPLVERPELCVIDLAGARPIHPLPRSRRVQNLARVLVSLEELPEWNRAASARFLSEYLGRTTDRERRRWWADLRARSQSKRAGNHRRGRAIS